MPVEMRDGAEPEARCLDRVHVRDAALLQVSRRAEPLLLRFVEQRRHDVWPLRAELQSVDAVFCGPLDVRTRLLG